MMVNPLFLRHTHRSARDCTVPGAAQELCVLTSWPGEQRGIQQELWDQGALLSTGRWLAQAAELLQSPPELPGCSLHPGLSKPVQCLLPQLSWKSLHAQLQSVCQLLCIFGAWDQLASAVRSKQAESSSSLKDPSG